MLIEFQVTNFRSFKEKQILSMVASNAKDIDTSIINVNLGTYKLKLLRTAVIYGANASGKTNIFKALHFAERMIVSSFDRSSRPKKTKPLIPTQPFKLDEESKKTPSSFEFQFIHNSVRYSYGFSVDEVRVQSEWLIAYPKGVAQLWFDRQWDEKENKEIWKFGPYLKGNKTQLKESTNSYVLFLSIGAFLNNDQLENVYNWFYEKLWFIGINDDITPDTLENLEDLVFQQELLKLLTSADLGITGIKHEKRLQNVNDLKESELPEELKKILETLQNLKASSNDQNTELHEIEISLEHIGNNGSKVPFKLSEESVGTLRFLSVAGTWLKSLEAGRIVIADELDASLHPILVRKLIEMFQNENINQGNAQLIFNTHDTTLLDLTLFRRDQIWFVEKEKYGESHLYPLSDFSPRKDESLHKGYLQGRYGAIPLVDNLIEGFDSDNTNSPR